MSVPPSESTIPTVRSISDRAALRKMQERRGRVLRRLAMMIGVTAVIIVMALVQRDNQSVRWEVRHMAELAAKFRQALAERGTPPDALIMQHADADLAERYFFNTGYVQHAIERGRSGVCCSRVPIRLFLRADRRVVLIFDGRDFEVHNMLNSDFAASAETLGLMLARQRPAN